jgi:serine/threonine-protein kinase
MTGLSVGNQLDHYRIDELIARSGMASLFRAIDLNTGMQVAIKLPHPEMECDPLLFDRFKREIEIGQKLDHPGVMKVYRDEKRSRVYMTAEWVEGKLLRRMLGPLHKLPVDRAIYLTVQILHALEYIHANGVVHRDLKPENIMVDGDDHIKLIDFGIAGNEGSRRLTFAKLSNVMGTPDYISPEQVKGKRGDGRADIYAMGVMLYEMLTGKMPFEGDNPLAIMNERLLNNQKPPREVDPSITPELQEIIYRALERDPVNRYPTAREFVHDLEHQDEVGVADRAEMHDWKVRKTGIGKKILMYIGLALIPVVIFSLLLWVARKA